MTAEQSRLLKAGKRVCWMESKTDLGTVAQTDWSTVRIQWDNGKVQDLHHNDMRDVGLV